MAECNKDVHYARLKNYLVMNDIKQNDLALLLQRNKSYISLCLNGKNGKDFSIHEVRTMCINYGITADDFFIKPFISN